MKTRVSLKERSYDIDIENGIRFNLTQHIKTNYVNTRFALVTNSTILKLYEPLICSWSAELDCPIHVIPDGEIYKTTETWNEILDFLLNSKLDRSSKIIAVGGGVVGDITGFAAATYLRGVGFIQVPTTLLAMVDSSVGGKTGVDHKMGKNLIGAFHQPEMVIIDTGFLDTLPERDFLSGYAELYKYAFISGREMFDFVNNNHDAMIKKDHDKLLEGIHRSVSIKANIVEQDEHEILGLRALLNFGHTFAHSIEKYFNFESVFHGEAVLWGIHCAYEMGKLVQTVSSNDYPAFENLLSCMKLPKLPETPDPEKLVPFMYKDKKVQSGRLKFVLPTTPGESIVSDKISEKEVIASLEKVFGSR
ncbi:MAG: 3-dehydroquinate synthase [Fibrobacter sp.]|nr:3-dehydroquinate synthase [Fibrobacter sp.]